MKHRKKAILVLMVCLLAGNTIPTMAANKKPIKTVSLKIDAELLAGTDTENEEIEIDTLSDMYSVESYEIMNTDIEWDQNSIPEIEITLTAADNYYFALTKATAVTLKGNADAEYKGGKKRDSSTTLVLTVKLHCITNGVGVISNAVWHKEIPCLAVWETTSPNVYETILYRDSKKIRTVKNVSETQTTYDFSNFMTQAGNYSFKIRGYNPDSGRRGEWITSEAYTLSEEIAKANRDNVGYKSFDGYGWQQDELGWWYKIPGGYRASEWLISNEHWFYLDESGYMVTGWKAIGSNWYCFESNGEMLQNTTTSDGYIFDVNGVCINP